MASEAIFLGSNPSPAGFFYTLFMNKKSTDELVKILCNFNQLHQKIEKADVIIVLGSHDIRVAERGAELYLQK